MNIHLITTNEDAVLSIDGPDAVDVYGELSAELGNCVTIVAERKLKTNPLFVKSVAAMNNFGAMCVKYGLKELWQFYSRIGRINDGSHYLLLPADDISNEDRKDLKIQLMAIDSGRSAEEFKKGFDDYSRCILQNYEIVACYSSNILQTKIGNVDKDHRMCRFCGRTVADGVTFDKKAHAISEFLGNKSIILHDECDQCNGGIVNVMESSMTTYFKALRPMLGVRGKSGIPVCHHRGIEIANNGSRHVDIRLPEDAFKIESVESGHLKASLEVDCGDYVPQHIYRMLAKYAVSVLPKSIFDSGVFQSLRDWIRGLKSECSELPLVAETVDGNRNPQNPSIVVYRRRDDVLENLPLFLVDLYIVAVRFMFELPYLGKTHKLVSRKSWQMLFDAIPSFGNYKDWAYNDFSSLQKCHLSNTIIFKAEQKK